VKSSWKFCCSDCGECWLLRVGSGIESCRGEIHIAEHQNVGACMYHPTRGSSRQQRLRVHVLKDDDDGAILTTDLTIVTFKYIESSIVSTYIHSNKCATMKPVNIRVEKHHDALRAHCKIIRRPNNFTNAENLFCSSRITKLVVGK
jgi:hypothetical protein